MKALRYEGNKQLILRDVPKPEINNEEVLIEVAYTGICGSDLLIWEGNYPRVVPPVTIGHEISGVVADVGEKISNTKIGSRVVINPLITCGHCDMCKSGDYNLCPHLRMVGSDKDGGMAEFVKVTEGQIFELPDTTSLLDASLIEPLAVGVHMVEKAAVSNGDQVLIVGAGPIGLIAAYIAEERGATAFVSEINDNRIAHAAKLGFKCINPIKTDLETFLNKGTNNKGVNAAFEVTGSAKGLQDCINSTTEKGKVIIAGMSSSAPEVEIYKIMKNELKVFGSRVYADKDYNMAIQLINSKNFNRDDFITDILNPESAVESGFEKIKNGAHIVKAVINMDLEEHKVE